MKRSVSWLSLLVAFSLLLTACTQAATPTAAQPITLPDGLGRTVTLAQPAQRIVSLAPSNTEILFAIGAGAQVVGRDEFTNYPEEAKTLPSVGGSMGAYDLEAIVALKPDLVLAAEINSPEMVKAMEDLGLTVYYLVNPSDLEGMYTLLETVAKLAGKETQTAELVESLRERVAAVEKTLAGATGTPKVFYELDGSDPAKPWTPGPGTFLNALVQKAGGVNVAAGLTGQYAQMSLEELLVQNPDIILLGDAAYGTTVESVAARAGWDAIKAVTDGRIETFNDDLVSRPGPRLVEGLETLAKLLHPELYK